MWKVRFLTKKVFWWLELATGTSCEFESQANCLAILEVLFCSVLAVVTLQLPLHTPHMCHFGDLPVASQSRDPIVRLPWIAHFWDFFTISHTLPLHNFHLNTEYLIDKSQAKHGIKTTQDWINSTLQSPLLVISWQNPKTNSRLNMWVGNSC